MRSKKVLKKWFRRVPKWTPKVDQNRQKGCSEGVSKRDLKKRPSPGSGKVRFCYYLLHFSKVGGFPKMFIKLNFGYFSGPHFDTTYPQQRFRRGFKKDTQKVVTFGFFLGTLLRVICFK